MFPRHALPDASQALNTTDFLSGVNWPVRSPFRQNVFGLESIALPYRDLYVGSRGFEAGRRICRAGFGKEATVQSDLYTSL